MTIKETAEMLLSMDKVEILTHHYPDGDTLGCAYALCLAFQQLGRQAKVTLTSEAAPKFDYLKNGVIMQDFEPEYIVSVDVASDFMLGQSREKYEGRIDLCIDHHMNNAVTAKYKCVESDSAAAAEVVYLILLEMGVTITKEIADCIYTAVSTDTGCFMYVNTSPRTHLIAAELMKYGCDFASINKVMFETKTKAMIKLERMLYDNMSFHCNDRCAVIYTTLQMQQELGLDDEQIEGIASIPRQIEGVLYGITIREKPGSTYKISVRTNGDADACAFCRRFDGGGHKGAAGCTLVGTLEEVKTALVSAVEECLS